MTLHENPARVSKLANLFRLIITGGKQVNNSNDARLFFEAGGNLCQQKEPVFCVEVIIESTDGVKALASAVRCDLSANFIASATLPFLKNLMDPRIETLNNGRFLQQLLVTVLEPSTFWFALLNARSGGNIPTPELEVFAWLCLHVVSSQLPELESQKADVEALMETKCLIEAQSHQVRSIGYRIEKILLMRFQPGASSDGTSPGGRHDNDFADFRQISIYPTTDEFLSTQEPYLQRLDDAFEVPMETRAQNHLDWLFRLLREDMLAELRDDLKIAMGTKKGRRQPLCLGQLLLVGVPDTSSQRLRPFVLHVACGTGVRFPNHMPMKKKKKFLTDHKNFMKHASFGVLCCEGNIVAFGSLVRDVDMLLKEPPVVGIEFTESLGLGKALTAMHGPKSNCLRFVVVDTATFAYEPILQRLKEIMELPLETHLLDPKQAQQDCNQPPPLQLLINKYRRAFEKQKEVEIPSIICPNKTIRLRGAQLESLVNGLSSELGQIQGPPGTGKSFIGALIVLTLLRLTKYRVLVLSYTNHALDQFIEELMDIGVKTTSIVRLGSKSTQATEATRLDNYTKEPAFRLTQQEWSIINKLKVDASDVNTQLQGLSSKLASNKAPIIEILDYLEFSEDYSSFFPAFQVPSDNDGFKVVGANNKAITSQDVYVYWINDAPINRIGNLLSTLSATSYSVWQIPGQAREGYHAIWLRDVRQEQIDEFAKLSERAKELQQQIDSIYNECKRRVLGAKRVIACTTTAAAMYQSIIKTSNPDFVLVEEAGEILEAHNITAFSPTVKQCLLIGDHEQLKPKVSNYKLTFEKGDGYDLNISLFERLIRQGHPYTTLQEQHRSHPDISYFTQILAYPDLKDVPSTYDRAPIRGLPSRVTFVHHEQPEEEMGDVGERRDPSIKGSKRNLFEAQMVLKMVRYLGQQGYKSENMVVLTPYLGQLALLRDTLTRENDPYLNDLDSCDLLRAGLIPEAAAKVNKKPLRLSTIDNYQGEECDIVIVSLTRSNASGDIGFLYARERLVVLMSRAKNGIILFGNMSTFMKSKKGGELWGRYFAALKDKNCLYDGVPVFCERHPERTSLLKTPEDFDQHCPDGGCAESWTCAQEDEATRRRVQRDFDMEKARQEKQDRYAKELRQIDDEIAHQRRTMKDETEEKDYKETLLQKVEHLKTLKETKKRQDEAKAREAQSTHPPSSDSNNKDTGKNATESSKEFDVVSSGARDEWEYMKRTEGAHNAALDQLMGMIGLESIKEQFISVKSSVDTKLRQGVPLTEERFSCSLLGNPGTGKTTVARIWASFLTTVGAIAGSVFKETTGSKLASNGVPACEKLLEDILEDGGGVLFIDEAYQLSSGNSAGGKAVLDYLLAEVENLRGKVVFVLAGYSKQMESFFAHNPGFPSRFPVEMKFEDYTDDELLKILKLQVNRKYNNRMKIQDGPEGLFFRIAARRVGYNRGKEGFGNARAVENCLATILQRQTNRLRRERRANLKSKPDDMLLVKEDIIGPEPSSALLTSKAYLELNGLIGLDKVKENLKVLMDTVKTNYERELDEQPLVEFSLNRIFLGSPGTGKTTVAKLFGQVLVDLGLLSNGEVVVKNPADFVGAALGQSEAQTKAILAATIGKVLVIDEAYGLYGGGGDTGSVSDPYKTAVVDTIVAEVQSVPGEDRCVLLLGYTDNMEKMLQNVNPGLSRRFPLSTAFVFEDFDDDALSQILDLKLKKSGFGATPQSKKVALEVLNRARNRPNFGNAGEIDILLGKAKSSHQKRVSAGTTKRRDTLEAVDFDESFDRAEGKDTDIASLFADDIGREKLIALLEGYQNRVRQCKVLDMDPEIPFNFLFRGPPGTGKTTTARKMGKVYYDMGFLAGTDVIECSATDLIGQYVGQTGPKVRQLLDKALGRVLFIDEAYRLGEGHFAKEAVDELVDSVTKTKYQGKLIIILAGYERDINSLLSVNPGMSSRFPEVVDFETLDGTDCIRLLTDQLQRKKTELEKKGKKFDISCLQKRVLFRIGLRKKLNELSEQDGWANARDIKHLAKAIFRSLDLSSDPLILSEEDVDRQLNKMFDEREKRATNKKSNGREHDLLSLLQQQPPSPSNLPLKTSTAIQKTEQRKDEAEDESEAPSTGKPSISLRDAGVSDAVWEQLQRDKQMEQHKDAEYRRLLKAQKTASDADREKITRQVLEEEERRRKAEAMKAKLMSSGKCPAGFEWIKQSKGYRCAGGSHWMANEEIEKLE
ncbi:hypothetical protein G7046_g2807 [Stylonectria norvegica]|nr:hypothetical protein G7046_g2807 [Stylonectria norvegica]